MSDANRKRALTAADKVTLRAKKRVKSAEVGSQHSVALLSFWSGH